jgi:hypothetical protein
MSSKMDVMGRVKKILTFSVHLKGVGNFSVGALRSHADADCWCFGFCFLPPVNKSHHTPSSRGEKVKSIHPCSFTPYSTYTVAYCVKARVRPKPTPTCSAVNAALHGSVYPQHNTAACGPVQTLRYLTHCNTHQRTVHHVGGGCGYPNLTDIWAPGFREPRLLPPHSHRLTVSTPEWARAK